MKLSPIEQKILDFISIAKTAELFQIAIAVNETSDIALLLSANRSRAFAILL